MIFFPIKTKNNSQVFNKRENKLGFEIHVYKVNEDYCTEELIEKVEAEEFEPFTRRDAKYVENFLIDYIFKKPSTDTQ